MKVGVKRVVGLQLQWANESENSFLECEEINVKEKRKAIKSLTRSQKANLLCLQETIVHEIIVELVRSVKGRQMFRMGFNGGLGDWM